jgi:hypothetical protein
MEGTLPLIAKTTYLVHQFFITAACLNNPEESVPPFRGEPLQNFWIPIHYTAILNHF